MPDKETIGFEGLEDAIEEATAAMVRGLVKGSVKPASKAAKRQTGVRIEGALSFEGEGGLIANRTTKTGWSFGGGLSAPVVSGVPVNLDLGGKIGSDRGSGDREESVARFTLDIRCVVANAVALSERLGLDLLDDEEDEDPIE